MKKKDIRKVEELNKDLKAELAAICKRLDYLEKLVYLEKRIQNVENRLAKVEIDLEKIAYGYV